MTLSDFSIKRPVFAWTLMFALIFFGAICLPLIGINENPDVEYPTVRIRYTYDGATPAVVEKDIIEPVEGVLVSMEGIRLLTSEAERGSGDITIEFSLDRDIDFALQEINSLLSRAQRSLPDTVEPPTVRKSNADDRPIMYLALQSENLSKRDLMLLFRDRIRDRLSTVEGVAEVRPFGFHEPVLRIELDAKKLKQYELTGSDIVASIQREHQELPAGRFEYGETEEQIRIMGEVSDVNLFQNLPITRRGGAPNYQPLQLKEVAKVFEGLENIRRISRVNGVPALGMAVQKQRGVNAVKTADLVKERLAKINAELPRGTELGINFDATRFIRESVNELLFTLILSALLTSLVCWMFIGSWTASVNILLAIPTAIMGTFIFIYLFGFTLNTFSILGLALAIGIVVDDAVVMLENIIRYRQLGYSRVDAAFKGAREISFAVLATTVALISIFIPITFMPGLEGRFFFEFAVTISVAVALSSLEALTLAPMRCSQFLKVGERLTRFGRWFNHKIEQARSTYGNILNLALDNSKKVILGSTLVFLFSLVTIKFLPTELEPAVDRGAMFTVFISPEGKSLEFTDEKVKEFEKIAMAHPDVERVFAAVGGFGQGGIGNRGNGVLILKDPKERSKSQFEVADDLRKEGRRIKDLRILIRDQGRSVLTGRRGSPLEFTISGPEADVQLDIFNQLKEKMEADPLIVGTQSDDVEFLPEVHIVPDRAKAAARGVEIQEIAETVHISLGGVIAGQYTKDSRRFDIFTQLQDDYRKTRTSIESILVRNNRGQLLPLSDVVRLEEAEGPQKIYREDRIRGLRVDASLGPEATQGEAVSKIKSWAEEILPPNYFLMFSATPQDKLFQVVVIMLLGLLVAYMILSIQFNSFVDPLMVFLAVPFGLSGSLLALLIGGQTLNIYSAIGILLTMGIVKKNSILLIEFTNQLRDSGKNILEALKSACTIRLRPILMTNTATLAAALPPALALGPGSETRIPMAFAVIGGVLMSVVFTLVVVPCVYYLIRPKRIHILEEDEGGKPF